MNYDKIIFKVRKGKRDKIKKLADNQGMSMQAFIISLFDREAECLNFDLTVPLMQSQMNKEK